MKGRGEGLQCHMSNLIDMPISCVTIYVHVECINLTYIMLVMLILMSLS